MQRPRNVRRKVSRVWLIGLTVLTLLVAACSSGDGESAETTTTAAGGSDTTAATTAPSEDPVPVSFGGSVTWYGHLPVMVAEQAGYFEEEGLDLTYEVILTSGDRLAALTAGDVDFSNLGRTALISAMAEGNESFYFIANIDDSPGQDGLLARPGIESIEDLVGLKVAANTSSLVTFMTHLEDRGLTGQVEIVNLSPADMCLALQNGDVDAIDVWQPLLGDCMDAFPEATLIAEDTESSIYEQFGTAAAPDIVIISRDLVDNQPEVAKRIMAAIFRGAETVNSDPNTTADLVADAYFQRPAEEVLEGASGFQFFGAENFQAHIEAHTAQMQWLAEWLFENDQISSVPDVSNWVNYDFVLELLEERDF